MTRPIYLRNNFFDGQEVSESDMDTEQSAWHGSLASGIDFLAGSGVEPSTVVPIVLFDTDDMPASIQSLVDNQEFDGEPIYETDAFDVTVFQQPSDSVEGNQLEVELTGASLTGSAVTKFYIFGKIYNDVFTHEVITFEDNGSMITRNYFIEIVSFMSQNFLGNQNTVVDGIVSSDVGGRIRVLEASPMTIARDPIMAEQSVEPNMDYVNFKPSVPAKTLDTLLNEIAASQSLNAEDLNINVSSTTTRLLSPSDSTGTIVGQKFKATTDNIQKISILLSVQENTLATPGEEFDWSGDLVVGIRKLQTTTPCPTDTIPNSAIEFDPEQSPIAEVSFNQTELEDLGIILDDDPKIVDFVFTQSLLSNPNVEPTIEVGAYYMITIRRTGNTNIGTIVLEEAANTNADPTETDEMRMSVFSQNTWTDITESDLWFKVYTDALRVVDGTALDDGIQITVPKIKINATTGLYEPYIEGNHSFLDVSERTKNYVIAQQSTEYSNSISHPTTGNQVFTRIADVASIEIVSESTLTTLIDSDNEPIVLGYAIDTNPISNPTIEGTFDYAGLVTNNTITIINPSSDIQINNLVGSIITPNINKTSLKYKIIDVEIIDDAYGDVNGDGVIDVSDVARAQELDGYSKDLVSGSLSSTEQRNAIVNGTVDITEILRADVTDDGIINVFDQQSIQQHVSFGTAFAAGATYKRAVLTVENLLDPLTTTVNVIGADSVFNNVPFTAVEFRIDFSPIWFPDNITITDLRRFTPKTFTTINSSELSTIPPTAGENTVFIPGDMVVTGDLLDTDGNTYSIDLEVNTITIDLPEGSTQGEVDIFSNFIKDTMYFYDGTLVRTGALEAGQVKISTAIGSFVKDEDGYDFQAIDGYAAIETTVALLYNPVSGVLRIRANNVRHIDSRPELRTKVVLTVYLKKAGFVNDAVSVSSTDLQELLVTL